MGAHKPRPGQGTDPGQGVEPRAAGPAGKAFRQQLAWLPGKAPQTGPVGG